MQLLTTIILFSCVVSNLASVFPFERKEESKAKSCEQCVSRCVPVNGEDLCPDDNFCMSCYRDLVRLELAIIDEILDEVSAGVTLLLEEVEGAIGNNTVKRQVGKMDGIGLALAIKDAVKRGSGQDIDADKMTAMVKKEIQNAVEKRFWDWVTGGYAAWCKLCHAVKGRKCWLCLWK